MKVAIYEHRLSHPKPILTAFGEGLRKHGVEPEIRPATSVVDCDLAVFWGHRRRDIIERQQRRGARYLVAERGYLGDRFEWSSFGYDGLNGEADFCLGADLSASRWKRHWADTLQPWKTGGKYSLLIGQVSGDASTAGIDLKAWYETTAAKAKRIWPRLPVVFRRHPHPAAAQDTVPGLRNLNGSLEEALQHAAVAITLSSNAGVLSVLAGVPTVAMDRRSMAWDVAAHDVDVLHRPDRAVWAHRLAWCQWTLEELASGAAWDHLKRGMD